MWHLALVGMRRGELCGLRWTDIAGPDIAFQAQTISSEITRVVVDGKVVEGDTKSETSTRLLPLTPELLAALGPRRARRPRSSSPPGPLTSAAATSSSTLWGGATTPTRCPTTGLPRVRRRA